MQHFINWYAHNGIILYNILLGLLTLIDFVLCDMKINPYNAWFKILCYIRHVLKGRVESWNGVESWILQIGVESWLNIWIGVYFNLQWVSLCPAVPEVAQSHVVTARAKRLSGVEWSYSLTHMIENYNKSRGNRIRLFHLKGDRCIYAVC
jgi:hypothetical protein